MRPSAFQSFLFFARPNDQYINNKPGPDRLKPDAPQHCTKRIGDVDKLCRAILDSLSEGTVYNDDAQVVDLIAHKRYANDKRTALRHHHRHSLPNLGDVITSDDVSQSAGKYTARIMSTGAAPCTCFVHAPGQQFANCSWWRTCLEST